MSLAEVRAELARKRAARAQISEQVMNLFERQQQLRNEIVTNLENARTRKFATPPNVEGAKRALLRKRMKEDNIQTLEAQMSNLLTIDNALQRQEQRLQIRESALELEALSASLTQQQEQAAAAATSAEQELSALLAELNAAGAPRAANENTNENEPKTICNKLGRCFRRFTGRKKKTAGGKRKGKSMKTRRRR